MQTVQCPNCGSSISKSAIKCGFCGFDITREEITGGSYIEKLQQQLFDLEKQFLEKDSSLTAKQRFAGGG